uniref:Kinase D-interacting substrate of 220 kDa-like SAM domain-containing protein n=1 Tax=Panagrolaimus davidi TaxID=227884 RepID=A0A914QXF4_9BILA
MALTGRLLRTFEIDFAWSVLYYWIALIEQWPYRMCWLLEKSQDVSDDQMTLNELYHLVKVQLPTKNVLIGLDRSHREFENFLRRMTSGKADNLTVRQMRNLVTCTSNLDPYLRKLIKDQRRENDKLLGETNHLDLSSIGAAEFLFEDSTIWNSITKLLVKMQIDDIINLVSKLNIPIERQNDILPMFYLYNLNGLVLQSCDLDELQRTLKLSLGDWTLIRLLIETLRKWKPSLTLQRSVPPRGPRSNSISRQQMPSINIEPPSQIPVSAADQSRRMNSIVEEVNLIPNLNDVIINEDHSDIEDEEIHHDDVDIDLLDSDNETEDTDSAKSVAGSRESLLHSE